MKNRFWLNLRQLTVVLFCIIGTAPLVSQMEAAVHPEVKMDIFIKPLITFPVGTSSEYFKPGVAFQLGSRFEFPSVPFANLGVSAGYEYSAIQALESLSIFHGGLEAGVLFKPFERLKVALTLNGGYYYSFFNTIGATAAGGNPYWDAGLFIQFMANSRWDIGGELAFRDYLGLKKVIGASLSANLFLKGREERQSLIDSSRRNNSNQILTPRPDEGIRLEPPVFGQIFPVFYSFYDENPIGAVDIINLEPQPVKNISISFFVKEYMDAPKKCLEKDSLDSGESLTVDLYALFNQKMMDITEGVKVAAEISVDYQKKNQTYRRTEHASFYMYDRNAMTWDDDRRAAAFVTAKDPDVLTFSKNSLAVLPDNLPQGVGNIYKAMAVHQALMSLGVQYSLDPKTPYEEFSKDTSQVDYLQFPRQTLEYRAGDCDDLSILYCALLEAVAIDTAFITVPGHIFMAFKLDMSPREASRFFNRPEDLVFKDEGVWIPLEITERRGGFLKAWETGASEWRKYVLMDQVGFYPVSQAWETFHPVGVGGGSVSSPPPPESYRVSFNEAVGEFIRREVEPRERKIRDDIRESGNNPRLQNRLGVLFARYGQFQNAETEFRSILSVLDYAPARINLGSLCLLQQRWQEAADVLDPALQAEPENVQIMLSLAEAFRNLEQPEEVSRLFSRIHAVDPGTAEAYSYLFDSPRETARASDSAEARRKAEWIEE